MTRPWSDDIHRKLRRLERNAIAFGVFLGWATSIAAWVFFR